MEECSSSDLQDKKCSSLADGESSLSMAMEVSNYETVTADASPPAPFLASELDRVIRLDIQDCTNMYSALLSCGHEGVVNSLKYALINLSADMSVHASRCEDPIQLKQYLITLAHPSLLDPDYHVVIRSLIGAMDRLPTLSRNSIVEWLKQSVSREIYLHFLGVIRQHITLRMYAGALEDARGAVRVLALLHAAHCAFPSVSASEFINDAICDDYMSSLEARKREYKLWLNDLGTTSTTLSQGVSLAMMVTGNMQSFISFNFVLTASAKAQVLELDAAVQMRQVLLYSVIL